MLTVSVSFESGSIMKTFITYFTLVCAVITVLSLMFLKLLFKVCTELTGVALKFLTVVFLEVYCKLPLASKPFATVFHHALKSWVFSMHDLMGLEFAFEM